MSDADRRDPRPDSVTASDARAPQPIGLGDPAAADRQGDIAADDAGITASVNASIGGVQGEDDANGNEGSDA